jgi:hypothetical protein
MNLYSLVILTAVSFNPTGASLGPVHGRHVDHLSYDTCQSMALQVQMSLDPTGAAGDHTSEITILNTAICVPDGQAEDRMTKDGVEFNPQSQSK